MREPILKYTVMKNCYIANKTVYEAILCECLNKSVEMLKIGGGEFLLITEQGSGQPDVIVESTGYTIDFKMMISETYKEFMSRTAPVIQEFIPGVRAYSKPPSFRKKYYFFGIVVVI